MLIKRFNRAALDSVKCPNSCAQIAVSSSSVQISSRRWVKINCRLPINASACARMVKLVERARIQGFALRMGIYL